MDDGQKSKLGFTVWACPQVATTADEPNNTVLCVHSVLGYTEVIAVMDNEALYSINGRNLDTERLSNTNYHRLSASSISIAFFLVSFNRVVAVIFGFGVSVCDATASKAWRSVPGVRANTCWYETLQYMISHVQMLGKSFKILSFMISGLAVGG